MKLLLLLILYSCYIAVESHSSTVRFQPRQLKQCVNQSLEVNGIYRSHCRNDLLDCVNE